MKEFFKEMEKLGKKLLQNLNKVPKIFNIFNLWSDFKLLNPDPDPGEPIIYGSGSKTLR